MAAATRETLVSYVHDLAIRVRARVSRPRHRIIPGVEIGRSIDIERLIWPLRYDICVRIELIRLLRDEWTLYVSDLATFLDRPQSRAYYTWFRDVACARHLPWICNDEKLLNAAFVKRVHDTARLWVSIRQHGYDAKTPVRVRSGRSIRPVSGKTITSRYFAGDGCHRLACLYLAGRTRLEPTEYEVQVDDVFEPLDNTAILIPRLPIGRAHYLTFISHYYGDGLEFGCSRQLDQYVASHKAHLLTELRSVLAFDLPRIVDA